jgi:hypothetical protein
MSFDDKRYRDEVLEPARKSGTLPELPERYEITETMTADEVVARVDEVRRAWRRARQLARFTTLVNRMTAEHGELEPLFEAARHGDLGPLRAELRDRRQRTAGRLTGFLGEVGAIAGEWQAITPQELRDAAARHGLPAGELAALIRDGIDGVGIREPDQLPASPPVAAFGAYRTGLQVLGHRHAPDFLAEQRVSGISIFDRFAARGRPGLRFDHATLQDLRERWAERRRDERSTSADTVRATLQGAVRDGTVLRLLQYELAEQLRERRRGGVPDGLLVTHAVDELGVEPEDARRLVFAIRHEGIAAGASVFHRQLEELWAAGRIYEASQLFVAVPSVPEDARELAAAIERRVAAAQALRDQTTATGGADPSEVDRRWGLLDEARRLVPDLPSVDEALRRLVPAPPRDVQVAVSGGAVAVIWQASRSRAGDVGYRVIRQTGRAPANVLDAEATVARTSATAARDESPLINETLYYAVVTQRGDTESPLVVGRPVRVRPEPEGVRLHVGEGVVEGRWELPAKAERVLVRRAPAGGAPPAAGNGVEVPADAHGFRDRDVRNGVSYRYWVGAVYLDRAGTEVTTPGTVLSATPARKPEPVRALRVRPDRDGTERLHLEFTAPEHGAVEIVELSDRPQWTIGREVDPVAVRAAGTVVAGIPTRTGITVRRPRRPVFYLALTVTGDMAVAGAWAEYVWVAPLAELTAQRQGSEVVLGWHWPADVGAVLVSWVDGEETRRLRVTKAGYQAGGGVRLPAGPARPTTISVLPVIQVGGEDRTGQSQSLTLPGRAQAHYRIFGTGPPWRRALVVEVFAEQPVRMGRLVLGLRAGRVFPLRLDQCIRLDELSDVDIMPGVPARLEIPVPRQARPYWLRCFVEGDEVELLDPPTDQLRRD